MRKTDLRQNFRTDDIHLENFIFLSDEEKEMLRSWRNNENIKKWMYTDHIITSEEHFSFIKGLQKDDRNYYWLGKDNDEYIGVIYLNRVDFENRSAFLGIYLNPYSEKRGMGTKLCYTLINEAFEIADFHTLKVEVLENNGRAMGFYKKAGFSEEGRLRELVFKDNEWIDVIIMGMINAKEGAVNVC